MGPFIILFYSIFENQTYAFNLQNLCHVWDPLRTGIPVCTLPAHNIIVSILPHAVVKVTHVKSCPVNNLPNCRVKFATLIL
jgi:hypothetical protein